MSCALHTRVKQSFPLPHLCFPPFKTLITPHVHLQPQFIFISLIFINSSSSFSPSDVNWSCNGFLGHIHAMDSVYLHHQGEALLMDPGSDHQFPGAHHSMKSGPAMVYQTQLHVMVPVYS
ncbi:hypothetical protein Hanom_Chr12g01170891 [Helianthus anomalus]